MANVKTFDFKSVGIKTTSPKQPNSFESIPIGIKTPMKLGQSSDGILQMNYDLKSQIKDNFKNLILTNHGERLIQKNFGANLKELTLELGTDLFDEELLLRINTAVSKNMPYIQLSQMQRQIDHLNNENLAKIKIKIFYNVPPLKILDEIIEVTFYIAG